jgi:signal transduction histidine kinase/ligand-binding sensor domain-containing protein/DNA-binding response OmpR family regulator
MIKFSQVIFCIICLHKLIPAQSEIIQFDHFNLDDGLSQYTVYCIIQDSKGFLWFGTADGLNRYDGYKFKIFRNDPVDSTSLSANRIYSLYEDSYQNLWIGTYGGGLNKFNRETESFLHYKNIPGDDASLSDDEVLSIYEDNSQTLWIGTEGGGLNKFLREENHFKHYKNNPADQHSLSDDIVQVMYGDRSGVLWIGTRNGGLNKFDIQKERFVRYLNNPLDQFSLSNHEVRSIYEDSDGNLWIGTGNGGLNKFDTSDETFIHYTTNPSNPKSISSNRIFSIVEDKMGSLWIGTMGGGLNKYIGENDNFISYTTNPHVSTSLSNDGIFSLFEDDTGVLWIGTYGGGVNKLDRRKEQFAPYRNDPNNPNSLSDNKVFSILEDHNRNIWIGTSSGLNKYDRATKRFTVYKSRPNDPGSLSNDEVLSIREDKSGRLWIGTYWAGLNLFDRKRNRFTSYKHDPNDPYSISENKIFTVYEDGFGYLWIGTDGGGLNRFDKDKKQFAHYKYDPNDITSISANRIFSICEDKSGDLWVGTDRGGLNKFNKLTNNFKNYKNDPNNPSSISSDGVFSIYESKSGDLWIGTYGGGLNKFIRDEEKFERFTIKDGLPSNVVYGILEDDSGNLWLSTNFGLSEFNPQSNSFKNYNVTDGLQSNEFNQGAFFKGNSGEMFFGGTNGFNIFHPDSIRDNPYLPKIAITEFQLLHKPVSIGYDSLFGRTILHKSISETEQIELNYDDNVISFEFAALDFWNPQKNQYAYIMEGFDEEWTHTNASIRLVTYTNLDPGEYFFKVKGSNNDGIWNEAGISLKIIIHPPWWATWWAYSIYGVLIVLLIFVLRQYDLRRQKLKQQLELEREHADKLEEIDQMKSRFFTNISHEFRTPLTLILGPAEKIISESIDVNAGKQAGLIKRNANRLLDLINQLLDLSKIEAGKLKLEASLSNLSSFVKGIAEAFESIAERKDITLRIHIEKQFIGAYFDKDKMQKIITNLLSNSFKFTKEGGQVEIKLFETERNSAIISVRDTGVGIGDKDLPKIFDRFYQSDSSSTRESGGTGIGLALTKELVELHNGKITIDSKEGEWTEVTVELPLGMEHLEVNQIVKLEGEDLIEKEIFIRDYIPDTAEIEDSEIIKIDKNIVLIVEDNYDVREFIRDSIGSEFSVVEAMNGEQGLRKAEKYIPDLIISDVMMPKMDGYELVRRIKQDEKTSHIPVILLTAKSDRDSKLEGLGLGVDDYLTKPFDTKELMARIKNLIETRILLQQKFSGGSFVQKIKDKPGLHPLDEKFMNKILNVIEIHLSEEEFSIEEISGEVGMSRAQIYRKLKALTGKSPSLFLRTIRLNKAKEMIQSKELSISEISYKVGFASPAYFSRCFKDEFGYPPSGLNN